MRMKNIFRILFAIALLVLTTNVVHAQKSKHKLADRYYETYDFRRAGDIYKDILSDARYAKDTLALRRVAICEARRGQMVNAEGYYKQLVETGAANEQDLKNYAEVLKFQGKYKEAVDIYAKVLQINPKDMIAKNYVDHPDFAYSIMRDSVIYEIRNSEINSSNSDFAPGFFINGKMIYSSATGTDSKNQRLYSWNEQPYLNLYTCEIASDSSLKSKSLIKGPINSRYHEGTMSYDMGNNLMYITRNNVLRGNLKKSRNGKLNLGIYTATYNDAEKALGDLKPFAHNNKEYSVGNPSLNASKTRLYFSSDMPGGYGATDIYYCEKTGDAWAAPVNAGSKINTAGNELFPYMVGDTTLYFSSNGHLCLGGLDVFYTNPYDSKAPANIGYPANSHYDDLSLICYPSETYGYLASNRKGGKGDDDIYEFEIHPPAEILVTGVVRDMQTLQFIPNALVTVPAKDGSVIQVLTNDKGEYRLMAPYNPTITLEGSKSGYLNGTASAKTNPRATYLENMNISLQKIDYLVTGKALYDKDNTPATGAVVMLYEIIGGDTTFLDSTVVGKTGAYMYPLSKDKKYYLTASMPGFSKRSLTVQTNDPNKKAYTHDFKLFKLEKGTTVRLDNIYYDYNSDVIRPDAAKELDKLVTILKDNPQMNIELSSHSDSRGGDDYNLKLSDRRARSAVKYIVSQGITEARLVPKGYGEQKILNKCANGVTCTDEEHGFNRRTEFTIL